jgi:hypothetical protein
MLAAPDAHHSDYAWWRRNVELVIAYPLAALRTHRKRFAYLAV